MLCLQDGVFYSSYYGDAPVQAYYQSHTVHGPQECPSSTILHLRLGGGAFSPKDQFSFPELFFERLIFFTTPDETCLFCLVFNTEVTIPPC